MVIELIRNSSNFIFIFIDQYFIILFVDFIMRHLFNCTAKINIVTRSSGPGVEIL